MAGYILVVGENVADAVVTSRNDDGSISTTIFPGGGPATTATALGRLGSRVRFAGRLPKSFFGDLFRDRLRSSGVDLSLSVSADEPATFAIMPIGPLATREHIFYAERTADWEWQAKELEAARFGPVDCLHAGSVSLIKEPGGPLIEGLIREVRQHATISIDPNVRTELVEAAKYQSRIAAWCRMADIVRLSHVDLAQIAPDVPVEAVFAQWHELGVALIVITRGSESVVASYRGSRIEIPAVPTTVQDTIGAGDAFSAGMLHWLQTAGALGGRLHGLPDEAVQAALQFAAHIAALTCSRASGNPPWRSQLSDEVLALLSSKTEPSGS